jgi:hypothetical protein
VTTDLTFLERTTLLVLMAESRPLRLTELPTLGSALGGSSRTKLEKAGLITSEKIGRGLVIDLTDKGWLRAGEEFGQEPLAAAARSGGKVLYTLMRAMRRYFDRVGIEPNEVFLPAAESTPTPAPAKTASAIEPTAAPRDEPVDATTRIRSAYQRLAREPKAFVSLARLRAALSDLDRNDVDDALSALYRQQTVNLIPEANQKTLTDEDRSAALHIGGQNRHNVAFK